jgi:hypothetical protein
MTFEAGVALGGGIRAQSTALVAFGADSIIELLSAIADPNNRSNLSAAAR